MTLLRRRQPATAYGSDDFAARLATREAALGIAPAAQDVHKPIAARGDAGGTSAPEPTAGAGDGGALPGRDRWGNALTSGPGLFGQYTFTSQWGDGRTVYVCGAPREHVKHWRFDGRKIGQGYVCAVCFTLEAGQFATKGR